MEKIINHLKFLKEIEMHDQGTQNWLNQRKGKLTSSDAATALGINPYKKASQLLLEKCGAGRSFEGNENTIHGHKYEGEAIKKYETLMLRENHVFGMISFSDLDPIRENNEKSKKYIDEKYHFLGGSPDGISINKTINDHSVLIQTEVKCPLKRKIKHGQIPDYYFPQIQLNMFILDLELTDFIEYIPDIPNKNVEMNIVRIYRDEEWFEKNFPILEKFWEEVKYWRTKDITTHPDYIKYYGIGPAPEYLFIEDTSEEITSDTDSEECLSIENDVWLFD